MKQSHAKRFNTIVELNEFFATEGICQKYLSQLRWTNNPECPHCNNIRVYKYKDEKLYKCARCRRQFSIKVGTLFEDSKIPLKKWFHAIYIITTNKHETSSTQLSLNIVVTQKTAWLMLHKIRQALRIKSFYPKKYVQNGNPKAPMLKRVNMQFEEVLKKLLNTDVSTIKSLQREPIRKTAKEEKPAYNRPSLDFDPETD